MRVNERMERSFARTLSRSIAFNSLFTDCVRPATVCNRFWFPSSFQLRPSLGKLSAARSIAFRALFQPSQTSDRVHGKLKSYRFWREFTLIAHVQVHAKTSGLNSDAAAVTSATWFLKVMFITFLSFQTGCNPVSCRLCPTCLESRAYKVSLSRIHAATL